MPFNTMLKLKIRFSSGKCSGLILMEIDQEKLSVSSVSCTMKNGSDLEKTDLSMKASEFQLLITKSNESISMNDPCADEKALIEHGLRETDADTVSRLSRLSSSTGDDYVKNGLIRDLITKMLEELTGEIKNKAEVMLEESEDAVEKSSSPAEKELAPVTTTGEIATRIILDPVSGIHGCHLEKGMKLGLRFTDQSSFDLYRERVLFLKTDNDFKKASFIGKILELEKSNDGTESMHAVLSLGEGIFSRQSIRNEMRVLCIKSDEQLSEDTEPPAASKNSTFFMIAGIAVLLLVLLVFLIFVILF